MAPFLLCAGLAQRRERGPPGGRWPLGMSGLSSCRGLLPCSDSCALADGRGLPGRAGPFCVEGAARLVWVAFPTRPSATAGGKGRAPRLRHRTRTSASMACRTPCRTPSGQSSSMGWRAFRAKPDPWAPCSSVGPCPWPFSVSGPSAERTPSEPSTPPRNRRLLQGNRAEVQAQHCPIPLRWVTNDVPIRGTPTTRHHVRHCLRMTRQAALSPIPSTVSVRRSPGCGWSPRYSGRELGRGSWISSRNRDASRTKWI